MRVARVGLGRRRRLHPRLRDDTPALPHALLQVHLAEAGDVRGGDVQAAVGKATDVAKKNLITLPIANGTIPHDVEVKLSGARVLLKPAAPGTGIIAGGVVRQIIGVTGVNNLLSKSLGSTNKVNIAYATIEALRSLVPREQWLNAPKKAAKKETK